MQDELNIAGEKARGVGKGRQGPLRISRFRAPAK
jgi:hypothetical protein